MGDAEHKLREDMIGACRTLDRRGINQGTSGNIGVRWADGLLITPSGLAYDTMVPEDIVYLHMDGTPSGPHKPSSEWRFHRDILRERPDIGAVVHAHPPYCTAFAILGEGIPAVHYMIAAAGGPTVRCAPYATFGSQALSEHAVRALDGRLCCLLANHGSIACGETLDKALWLAGELETLARQYFLSRQLGKPVILPDDEIDRVAEKFKSYGPKSKA